MVVDGGGEEWWLMEGVKKRGWKEAGVVTFEEGGGGIDDVDKTMLGSQKMTYAPLQLEVGV